LLIERLVLDGMRRENIIDALSYNREQAKRTAEIKAIDTRGAVKENEDDYTTGVAPGGTSRTAQATDYTRQEGGFELRVGDVTIDMGTATAGKKVIREILSISSDGRRATVKFTSRGKTTIEKDVDFPTLCDDLFKKLASRAIYKIREGCILVATNKSAAKVVKIDLENRNITLEGLNRQGQLIERLVPIIELTKCINHGQLAYIKDERGRVINDFSSSSPAFFFFACTANLNIPQPDYLILAAVLLGAVFILWRFWPQIKQFLSEIIPLITPSLRDTPLHEATWKNFFDKGYFITYIMYKPGESHGYPLTPADAVAFVKQYKPSQIIVMVNHKDPRAFRDKGVYGSFDIKDISKWPSHDIKASSQQGGTLSYQTKSKQRFTELIELISRGYAWSDSESYSKEGALRILEFTNAVYELLWLQGIFAGQTVVYPAGGIDGLFSVYAPTIIINLEDGSAALRIFMSREVRKPFGEFSYIVGDARSVEIMEVAKKQIKTQRVTVVMKGLGHYAFEPNALSSTEKLSYYLDTVINVFSPEQFVILDVRDVGLFAEALRKRGYVDIDDWLPKSSLSQLKKAVVPPSLTNTVPKVYHYRFEYAQYVPSATERVGDSVQYNLYPPTAVVILRKPATHTAITTGAETNELRAKSYELKTDPAHAKVNNNLPEDIEEKKQAVLAQVTKFTSPLDANAVNQLNLKRIKELTGDTYFLQAAEYFNSAVLGSAITWEMSLALFERFRGDLENKEYTAEIHKERLHTLKYIVAAEADIISLANMRFDNRQDVLNAAAKLHGYIIENEILMEPRRVDSGFAMARAGLPGFDSVLELSPGSSNPASGHHRLAWFLMNYLLINNGYTPIYLDENECGDGRRYGRPNAYAVIEALRERVGKIGTDTISSKAEPEKGEAESTNEPAEAQSPAPKPHTRTPPIKDLNLIVFDLDGTLTRENAWTYAARETGVADVDLEGRRLWMAGKISYKAWCDMVIRAWRKKGLKIGDVKKVLDKIEVIKGIKETFEELHRRGYKIAIISAGLRIPADKIRQTAHVDYVYANDIKCEGEEMLECEMHIDNARKILALREICKKEDVSPRQVCVIGDSENDCECMKNAGFSIALNGKDEVKKIADIVIETEDLREILRIFSGKNKNRTNSDSDHLSTGDSGRTNLPLDARAAEDLKVIRDSFVPAMQALQPSNEPKFETPRQQARGLIPDEPRVAGFKIADSV
jgi:phosphoserine phosphatase